MKQARIDQIKTDAVIYMTGIPSFNWGDYLMYSKEELAVWEDGVLEASEFLGLSPPEEFDVGTSTDGDQEMDLMLGLGIDKSINMVGWECVEGFSCH